MPLIMGQATVPSGGGVVPCFEVPPGPCSVTWYNLNTLNTIYLGTSTAVTATNGLAVHNVPVTFQGFMTSRGTQVYGTTGTFPTGILNYLIMTDQ